MLPNNFADRCSQPSSSWPSSLCLFYTGLSKQSRRSVSWQRWRNRWTRSHWNQLQSTSRESWYHQAAVRTWSTAPLRQTKTRTGNLTFVSQCHILVLVVLIDVKGNGIAFFFAENSVKTDSSTSNSEPDFESSHNHNRKGRCSRKTEARWPAQGTVNCATARTITPTASPINNRNIMTKKLIALRNGQNDFRY